MKFKNFAKSELSSQLLIGGTSLIAQSGAGTLFPDTGSTNVFQGVIWGSSFVTPSDDVNREVVEAYRSSGDTFTIVRAQEGTSAKQWEIGDNFMLTLTAGTLDSFTGEAIHAATAKTTPVDADELGLIDSAASNVLKKLTWDNLKATILAYFTTVTTTWSNKTLTAPVLNGALSGDAKATGATITTGTADDEFVTPKALADALIGKIQVVDTSSSAVIVGSGIIPLDDTIPQQTEGDQYMTASITPTSATSVLLIEATVLMSSASAEHMIIALFQDSTANALAVSSQLQSANAFLELSLKYKMTSGTTSPTTFKIRGGGVLSANRTFNGIASNRYFGAIQKSSLKVTEYKA